MVSGSERYFNKSGNKMKFFITYIHARVESTHLSKLLVNYISKLALYMMIVYV